MPSDTRTMTDQGVPEREPLDEEIARLRAGLEYVAELARRNGYEGIEKVANNVLHGGSP